MQQIYIPVARLSELKADKQALSKLQDIGHCKITIEPELAVIDGDPYDELVTANMLQAYGRGFEVDDVLQLINDDYYFSVISLKQLFGNEKRIKQVKARVIGKQGKTRSYIESVSGAKVCVYGNTIGIIGNGTGVQEAETAIYALIEGSNHRKAYAKMEAMHRKHKTNTIMS